MLATQLIDQLKELCSSGSNACRADYGFPRWPVDCHRRVDVRGQRVEPSASATILAWIGIRLPESFDG
jgi:hypothetical protein